MNYVHAAGGDRVHHTDSEPTAGGRYRRQGDCQAGPERADLTHSVATAQRSGGALCFRKEEKD